MKITVAIPHYNSLDTLWKLLAQLREDTFDQIVVLDDNSDIKPIKLEAEFPAVTFHYGSKSVGAGANRNRILDIVNEGIVWFVNADMEVVSIKNADRLKKSFEGTSNLVIGGLIHTKAGPEMEWNYGHEMHPVHDGRFEELTKGLRAGDTTAWARLQENGWDYAWLQPGLGQAVKRTVDWAADGNFALPIELFRQVGGYDTVFHDLETQELAKRLRIRGAKIQFTPDIIVRHLKADPRENKKHIEEFRKSQYLFFQKYWDMPRDIYEKLYS